MLELRAKLVGRSRGSIHIRIGNDHPDSLIAYPDVHNLSACAQPIRIMPRRWGCGSWRCLQMVVWHGLATRSKESAGVEGAGGVGRPGCGARGRWRGLAGQRADAQAHVSTPGPTGVEGAGGSGGHGRASRSTTPSEARVWRSRGRPGPTVPGTPAAPQAPCKKLELLVVLRVLVGLAAVGAAERTDRSHLLRRQ